MPFWRHNWKKNVVQDLEFSKLFHIFALRKDIRQAHSFTHSSTHNRVFFETTRYLSNKGRVQMKWRFDKDKVEDTFKGVDSDINREKLQEMAAEEGIELSFERWDELLRDVRFEQSTDSNDSHEKQNDSISKPKYVYNFDGQLIETFNTTKECAEFFGVSREAVAMYSRSERPYYKLGIVITNDLKDEKHKPYVKKRRLWFSNMFNEQNHWKPSRKWTKRQDDALYSKEFVIFEVLFIVVIFLGGVQYGTSPFWHSNERHHQQSIEDKWKTTNHQFCCSSVQ